MASETNQTPLLTTSLPTGVSAVPETTEDRPRSRRVPWMGLMVAVALLAASGVVRAWQSWGIDEALRQGRESPFPLAELPMTLGDWEGETREMAPEIARATGCTDHVFRSYRNDQDRLPNRPDPALRPDPGSGGALPQDLLSLRRVRLHGPARTPGHQGGAGPVPLLVDGLRQGRRRPGPSRRGVLHLGRGQPRLPRSALGTRHGCVEADRTHSRVVQGPPSEDHQPPGAPGIRQPLRVVPHRTDALARTEVQCGGAVHRLAGGPDPAAPVPGPALASSVPA